ncbi:MAG: DUF1624 domain-containing protein [Eubacterium sp.]|jgi:uncharacterized membrane protein|nr:DUF1624 domain-containing protein [Eubacterium sp.]
MNEGISLFFEIGLNFMVEDKRVALLDEIRGFCILCMVVYHIMFDLKYLSELDIPVFFDWWFDYVRDMFAGAFIFISGSVTAYSKSNLKRGAKCFFLGMIVTFVTAFAIPWTPVYFGILHMLGVSMMLFGLFERFFDCLRPVSGIIIFVILFFISFNLRNGYLGIGKLIYFDLPQSFYKAKLLFPLGFADSSFVSGDYFPLVPWFFLFVAGSYLGKILKREKCAEFIYRPHCRPLGIVGRNTIWIYLLHQPLVYFSLKFIFKF